MPGYRKEIEINEDGENSQMEILDGVVRNDLSEDEPQHGHHDQGVQKGPEDAERHVAIPDPEVPQDQVV